MGEQTAESGRAASNPLAAVDHMAALQDGRRRLLDAISGLDDEGAEQVVHGEWRVHDLLTHVAAWDELLAAFLHDVADGRREFAVITSAADGWAAWNAERVAEARDAGWDDRLERLSRARYAMFEAVSELDAATLDLEITAPWGETDQVRGHVLVQAVHEAQHADAVRAAREA